MKIYTKTGDRGETSLYGGQRVPKDAIRIEAYGTVDELNALVGIAGSEARDPDLRRVLAEIQSRLFDVGADLATPHSGKSATVRRIQDADIQALEQIIDKAEQGLTPLKTFILPGGSPLAAKLHLARTVCRRAERLVVRLSHTEETNAAVVVFLNRLSDLLFVLARQANRHANIDDVQWKP